jgi:hypothetical protein
MEKSVCQVNAIPRRVRNAEWVGFRHYTVAKSVPTTWTTLDYRCSLLTDHHIQGIPGGAVAGKQAGHHDTPNPILVGLFVGSDDGRPREVTTRVSSGHDALGGPQRN